NAAVLIEQTIGRGLRLPFGGKRTGVPNIDKLTVIAHDNFESVIAEAQNPDSVLNKLTYAELDEEEIKSSTIAVTSVSTITKALQEEEKKIEQITEPEKKQEAQNIVDAKKAIVAVLPTLNKHPAVKTVDDLVKPEVKAAAIEKIKDYIQKGQLNLFAEQIVEDVEVLYDSMVSDFKTNIIEIPRMDLVQGEARIYFDDFDLDTSEFRFKAMEDEIFRVSLKDRADIETLQAISSGSYGDPIKNIIVELLNFPEIDYDDNAELLYKLAHQAFYAVVTANEDPKDQRKAVFQFKKAIAERIYVQMKKHFRVEYNPYDKPKILPFLTILPHNFSALADNCYKDYRDVVTPASQVTKYVFSGFTKACHLGYKFDSNTEKELAYVLEHDAKVLKWLRPATNQFHIYWDNNSRRYEPDFVVETEGGIYMIEVKGLERIHDPEVLQKAEAARIYCRFATEYNAEHGKKPWKYLLIPHDEVYRTVSFGY